MTKIRMYQIIGVYEILSGLGGIVLSILSLDFDNSVKLAFAIFGMALFTAVLLAGIGLYMQKETGFRLRMTVQLLQILNLNLFGIKYIFSSGSKLTVYFQFPEIEIDYALIMQEITVAINPKSPEFLSINLIPILVCILLLVNNKK